jgi:hypothetical protein
MKTATFWLVLLAALPGAAGGKKTADDLHLNLRNANRNARAAGYSTVWAPATPNGLSVIWGALMVWAGAFAGRG